MLHLRQCALIAYPLEALYTIRRPCGPSVPRSELIETAATRETAAATRETAADARSAVDLYAAMRATLLAAALAAALLLGAAATAAAPGIRGGPPKAKPRTEDIPYIRCQASLIAAQTSAEAATQQSSQLCCKGPVMVISGG